MILTESSQEVIDDVLANGGQGSRAPKYFKRGAIKAIVKIKFEDEYIAELSLPYRENSK